MDMEILKETMEEVVVNSTTGSSGDVGQTAQLYGLFFLFVALLYIPLRKRLSWVYAPRSRVIGDIPGPDGYISWMPGLLWDSNDQSVLNNVGLDGFVYLRMVKMFLMFFAITAPLGIIVLGTSYAVIGSRHNDSKHLKYNLERISLTNIVPSLSPTSQEAYEANVVYWLACVLVMIFTAVGMWLLRREYVIFIEARQMKLTTTVNTTYTILVERIPRRWWSEAALREYFESMFPDLVAQVELVPKPSEVAILEDKIFQREIAIWNLERIEWEKLNTNHPKLRHLQFEQDDRRDCCGCMGCCGIMLNSRHCCYGRLPQTVNYCGCCGPRGVWVDSIPFYTQRIETLNKEIPEYQKSIHSVLASEGAESNSAKHILSRQQPLTTGKEEFKRIRQTQRETAKANIQDIQDYLADPSDRNDESQCSNDSHCSSLGESPPSHESRRVTRQGSIEQLAMEDAIHKEAENELNNEEQGESAWLLQDDFPSDFEPSAAFVTFNKLLTRSITTQCNMDNYAQMTTRYAPSPEGMIWWNLGQSSLLRLFYKVLVYTLNTILLFVFGILTSLISASTNLNSIRAQWKELDSFLTENPSLSPLFDQIAPLLLVITFALVTPVLYNILLLTKPRSWAELDRQYYKQYLVFLVVMVFLFFQVSGALYFSLGEAYEDPRKFVIDSAQNVANNSTFFVQYLLVRIFLVYPLELLRIADVAVALLVRPILCGFSRTPREKREPICGLFTLHHPTAFFHAKYTASTMLIFFLGVTYSVMAPIMLVMCLCEFIINLLTFRYQLQYVYINPYDSNGRLWTSVYWSICFGFILLHVTMFGVFVARGANAQAILMIPTVAITLLFCRQVDSRFSSMARDIPLRVAWFDDQNDPAERITDAFLHPVFAAKGIQCPERQKMDSGSQPEVLTGSQSSEDGITLQISETEVAEQPDTKSMTQV